MELKIIERNLDRVRNKIGEVPAIRDKQINQAMLDIALVVQATAKDYAPISNDNNPGGLERSIDIQHNNDEAIIAIDSSSEAGDYAEFIHDADYNLGEASLQKGGLVGPKFIERAIDDNEDTIIDILNKAVANIAKEINK